MELPVFWISPARDAVPEMGNLITASVMIAVPDLNGLLAQYVPAVAANGMAF